MKDTSSRELGSSAFLFTDALTLVSYVPTTSKKKKNMLLLSSMHLSPSLGQTGKPVIVEFYNKTKGGVDAFDQMSAIYSCGRCTNRWPMCIFYGMINTAAINSWVIHSENTSASGGAPPTRRKFKQEIAKTFIKPWATQRLNTPTLPTSLRGVISEFCKVVRERSHKVVIAASRFTVAYCEKCPAKKHRKTRFHCVKCDASICLSHCYALCVDCEGNQEDTHSSQEDTHSSQELSHSSQEDAHSSQQDAHSSQQDTHSSQELSHSSQEDTHSSQEDTHSSQELSHSSQEDTHSSQEDAHSSQEDTHSSQEDAHSSQEDIQSSQEDIQSSQEDTHSPQEDTHSSQEDTHSIQPTVSVLDDGEISAKLQPITLG
ncbi:hypothetical protein Pcinc_007815 [Petrolisthes cinctipes]|uniref:PiggyBac transposable element-derived protein domain-containing protein n=1 Tax=Petrolisthes cinctipes TaxID=88211 RepID=A0AAE1G7Q3_PETCI|nr:hypothetical protein Pcinc_007815 [Petrolisthes cinctipes]